MFKNILGTFLVLALLTNGAFAMDKNRSNNSKTAIVIAAFGTTYPKALKSILNVKYAIQKEFPNTEVKMAFTSNIIREIWHKRRNDPSWTKRKDIPKEIFSINGPLATIAHLQDRGFKKIIVQSTHFYAGEEYMDLVSYVRGLNSIKTIKKKYMPFDKLVVGRPITGEWGVKHNYNEDVITLAKALKKDIELARKKGAALVYMGHGNEYFSTGIYAQLQDVMRKMYSPTKIFIGVVEGYPSLEHVLEGLKHTKTNKVVLKPLMLVAGDHANNDMAGEDKDSWKSQMENHGIKVYPILEGLGENEEVIKIIVEHVKDAAKDNNLELN